MSDLTSDDAIKAKGVASLIEAAPQTKGRELAAAGGFATTSTAATINALNSKDAEKAKGVASLIEAAPQTKGRQMTAAGGFSTTSTVATLNALSSKEAEKAKGIASLIEAAPQTKGRQMTAAGGFSTTSTVATLNALSSKEAEKAKGIASLIEAAPQTKGRQRTAAGGFATTSTVATLNALNSKEAEKARGVAALIKGSNRSKGRLVAAAAAAAAAASVGFAAMMKSHEGDERVSTAPPPPPDEMAIMYSVLMSQVPAAQRGTGLTLDMVAEWDQVQEILESGSVDEASLIQIFNSAAVDSDAGLVLTKEKFGEFALALDEASEIGEHKLKMQRAQRGIANAASGSTTKGTKVNKRGSIIDVSMDSAFDQRDTVVGIDNSMVSSTKIEMNSEGAMKARGVADLIKNSAKNKGRLGAAAAAAAAAASVGFAAMMKSHEGDERVSTAPPPPPDEMAIMYSVLMSQVPAAQRGSGLTLDMVAEWDQVQEILESGSVDEASLIQIFNSAAVDSDAGLVILKEKFGEFAEKLDEASEVGAIKMARAKAAGAIASGASANKVNKRGSIIDVSMDSAFDQRDTVVGIDNSMVSSTKIEMNSEGAMKARGVAALIQGAPQVQGRNVAAEAAMAAGQLKTSGASTQDSLNSEGALKARGVANLIKNSAKNKGRIVAAAAAAAAAAAVGRAAAAEAFEEEAGSDAAHPPPPDDMSIMYAVLMSQIPAEEREGGLTLDMVAEWDQVQEILESGFINELELTDLFEECAEDDVITQSGFRTFAEKLDEASDIGAMKVTRARAASAIASGASANKVNKRGSIIDVSMDSAFDQRDTVVGIDNSMVSSTKIEMNSEGAMKARGVAALIQGAPQVQGRNVAAEAAMAAGQLKTSGASTQDSLNSEGALKARGVANLIKNSAKNKGRLVAAAAAAAAAAAIGRAAAAEVFGEESVGESQPDDMTIMYAVLISKSPIQHQTFGLTLEMIIEWDQVSEMINIGTIDEGTVADVFLSCAEKSDIGSVITEKKFGEFSKMLDEASASPSS